MCSFNDFPLAQDYDANDWVISTTTEAGAEMRLKLWLQTRRGALVITNDDADNDVDSLQMTEENWRLASGKQMWMNMN